MSISLIQDYKRAKAALYEHVGFVEDEEVKYPVIDLTQTYWSVEGDYVIICNTVEEFLTGVQYGNPIHQSELLKYEKGIFTGKDLTLIICDSDQHHYTELFIFDNTKRQYSI